MDQEAWIIFFVGFALASGALAIGIILYTRPRDEHQGFPFEAAIENALLPLIYDGICAAYRLNEHGVDELHQRIQGADKKRIADTICSMLPEKVGDFDLNLVKRGVAKERFQQLVQDAFDRFDRFFGAHQKHFDEEFEK
jgi:hypothetical protein